MTKAGTAPGGPSPLARGVRIGLGGRGAKQEEKRRRLIDAAAAVIGRHGYAGCSIDRITAKARVAHGAFYLHFRSQQELFDSIVPTLYSEMLRRIAEAISEATDFREVERQGFRANLKFSIDRPHINRVLWEAELYAPYAYRTYMDHVLDRYTASLRRSKANGSLAGFDDHELRFLAIMLIGARTQLTRSIARLDAVSSDDFEAICAIYDKLVAGLARNPSAASREPARTRKAGRTAPRPRARKEATG